MFYNRQIIELEHQKEVKILQNQVTTRNQIIKVQDELIVLLKNLQEDKQDTINAYRRQIVENQNNFDSILEILNSSESDSKKILKISIAMKAVNKY